jgi:NAD+ synthase
MRRILLPEIDLEQTVKRISEFVVERVQRAGASGCVIGLSGGVDSTTTAAFIKRAFDAYNARTGTSLELVGYILPSNTNDPADARDGIAVAERLGIRYEVHGLEPIIEAYRTTNPEAYVNRFDLGNLISRVRANVLNSKAATERKTLAGTGNKDEDFGIGYYTLFGDGAVHMSPIGSLSKRLVRDVASYLGFKDLAYREPTAGLEPGQTDFKDLGYRYDVVELVAEGLRQGFTPGELASHEQVAPIIIRQQREYRQLYGAEKFESPRQAVDDIVQRNRIAQAKAEIIHPPTPEVALIYK